MEFIRRNPKIFMISGKAGTGKNTVSSIIKEFYGENAIEISFSYYIKDYAKRVSNWDGSEDTKPRELLQHLGIELVRNKINPKLFINRTLEDIEVFSYFYDVIIISGWRLVEELEDIKSVYPNSISIGVISNKGNNLTESEKNHLTEVSLDNYSNYDYVINNNDSYETLKNDVLNILKEV